MKILNLYAGIGGNRKLWGDDHEITAIELEEDISEVYKLNFPNDTVIITDAHQYLLDNYKEFDFIWSSPPCQSHSKMIISGRNRTPRYPDMKLYEEILFLKHYFKGKYVVENVIPYYQPLIAAKQIGRHLFWSNFKINVTNEPKFKNIINSQNLTSKKQLQDWIGIYYDKNIYYKDNHCPTQILRNCVHPEIGLQIINSALNIIKKRNEKQIQLF